jgi:hypothetical protein
MYHFKDPAQISIIYWHIVLLKQLLHLVIVELAGVIKVKVFEKLIHLKGPFALHFR